MARNQTAPPARAEVIDALDGPDKSYPRSQSKLDVAENIARARGWDGLTFDPKNPNYNANAPSKATVVGRYVSPTRVARLLDEMVGDEAVKTVTAADELTHSFGMSSKGTYYLRVDTYDRLVREKQAAATVGRLQRARERAEAAVLARYADEVALLEDNEYRILLDQSGEPHILPVDKSVDIGRHLDRGHGVVGGLDLSDGDAQHEHDTIHAHGRDPDNKRVDHEHPNPEGER